MYFSLLTFIVLIFILILYIKKEFEKTYILYSIFLFLIFYTPSVYYIFGGNSYKYFSDETFNHYMLYSSLIFAINILILGLKYTTGIPLIKIGLTGNEIIKSNILTYAYIFIITIIIFFYIFFNFYSFPLISLAFNGVLLERPDITGSIPNFYSFSTIMVFVIPSFYFLLYNKIKNYKLLNILSILVVMLLCTISGHKGIVTFLFVFFWIVILKLKIDLKFPIILLVLIFIYAVTKGVKVINNETLGYLIESPLRRFFVTQGTCFIYRIYAIDIDYSFIKDIPLKVQICDMMYGGNGNGCSSPTVFIGDMLIKYGYLISTLTYTFVVYLIVLTIKNIDYHFKRNYFVLWSFYSIMYLIGMAEISIYSFIRITIILLNFLIIILLSQINKNTLNEYFRDK